MPIFGLLEIIAIHLNNCCVVLQQRLEDLLHNAVPDTPGLKLSECLEEWVEESRNQVKRAVGLDLIKFRNENISDLQANALRCQLISRLHHQI